MKTLTWKMEKTLRFETECLRLEVLKGDCTFAIFETQDGPKAERKLKREAKRSLAMLGWKVDWRKKAITREG